MIQTPIALQLYSVRDDCARDLPGTLQKVAQIGYEAVEFAGYYDFSAPDLRKMLDDNGLICAGTHTSLDSVSDQNLEATAAFNATLGNPYLIVPGVGSEYHGTRDGAIRLAEKLTQASKTAAEFGARVGYHNHSWEFAPLPNGDFPLEIMAINSPPEVILQVDTGNAQEGGAQPAPFLQKWSNRLATVHLKPFSSDFERYFIGEDDSNWQNILGAINFDVTKFIIIEQERYPQPLSPLDCVKRCLENFKKLSQ